MIFGLLLVLIMDLVVIVNTPPNFPGTPLSQSTSQDFLIPLDVAPYLIIAVHIDEDFSLGLVFASVRKSAIFCLVPFISSTSFSFFRQSQLDGVNKLNIS